MYISIFKKKKKASIRNDQKAAQTLRKIESCLRNSITLNAYCVAALQIMADVPSWQVPHRHFHSETGEVSTYFKTP